MDAEREFDSLILPEEAEAGQVELMKAALKYQRALVSYAYGLLHDWALAEDAVQEALLVLLRKWREFKPEFGVFGWARQVVFRKVQELRRSRRRERVVEDGELRDLVDAAMDEHFDEARARAHDPLLQAYSDCMGKLKPESQDLLVRYYWNREPGEKIAGTLRRSVNAVWLSLSRTRKALRDCIARRGGPRWVTG